MEATTARLIDVLLTLVGSFIASSGFWLFITKRNEVATLRGELLIGLAHDRITWLGMSYIRKGFITQEEYENLIEYLFKPYEKIGGNGTAKRVIDEVNKLPIRATRDIEK